MTARILRRPIDRLQISECPLHTERPDWEAQAPAQIEASLQWGSLVVGYTELGPAHKATRAEAERLCKKHGYIFYGGPSDSALAYRADLRNVKVGTEHVAGRRARNFVSFSFFGRTVIVYTDHWEVMGFDKDGSDRREQTASMIAAMEQGSKSYNLSFCMADSNPSRPLRDPLGEPQHSLKAAGIVTIWDELNYFPKGVGVTLIARNTRDTSVSAIRVELHPDLGSDHRPATATYGVKRRWGVKRRYGVKRRWGFRR